MTATELTWLIIFGIIGAVELWAVLNKQQTLSQATWKNLRACPLWLRIIILCAVLFLIFHLFCYSFFDKGCI